MLILGLTLLVMLAIGIAQMFRHNALNPQQIIEFAGAIILFIGAIIAVVINRKLRKFQPLKSFLAFGSMILLSLAAIAFGYFTVIDGSKLIAMMSNASNWEQTRNLHSLQISGGRHDWEQTNLNNENLTAFYDELRQTNSAFIIDPSNILFIENDVMPFADMTTAPPLELTPHGNRITATIEYLNRMGVNDDIISQIDSDTDVLNIIVPENLRNYESQITELYLEEFYFSKIGIANMYNEELNLPQDETTIDDLSVNIIYAPVNSSYFVYDYRVAESNGNVIVDPIIWIDTNNVSVSRLATFISNGLLFSSASEYAMSEIQPIVSRHNLDDVIIGTDSLFAEYQQHMNRLYWSVFSRIGLIAVMALTVIEVNKSRKHFTSNSPASDDYAIPAN